MHMRPAHLSASAHRSIRFLLSGARVYLPGTMAWDCGAADDIWRPSVLYKARARGESAGLFDRYNAVLSTIYRNPVKGDLTINIVAVWYPTLSPTAPLQLHEHRKSRSRGRFRHHRSGWRGSRDPRRNGPRKGYQGASSAHQDRYVAW